MAKKIFGPGKLQQTGTVVTKDSMPPSKKGKSRSAYNTLANVPNLPRNSDGNITSLPNGRKPGQVNKYTTKRHADKSNRCNVMFFVFLS